MKKLIATLLAVVMLATLSVCAFAATADNFTKSPTVIGAPVLTYDPIESVGGCTPSLAITPYSDRNMLSGDAKTEIEAAYSQIVDASGLRELYITNITGNKLRLFGLGVSHLFNITFADTEETHTFGTPGTHTHTVNLHLTDSAIRDFKYLLQFDGANWSVVGGITISGNTLTFSLDDLDSAAFALLVRKDQTSPETGVGAPIACAVGMVVFGAAGAILLKKSKEV